MRRTGRVSQGHLAGYVVGVTETDVRVLGGRYALERLLATGGMGEVWQGFDTVLARQVAVKLPRPGLAGDPAFLARFRNEARHAAPLVHPNIAAVFDFGGDGDVPYLVLELIDGEPLSHIIARDGPLTADRVRSVLRHVASALACAHAAGVVHRDIKPANLLVCPDGTVKVTDFGIARAVDAAAVTQVGFITGTAQYLSPEQLTGETASGASDLYALGVVGYECLTGRRPYEGDPAAIWRAHAEQAVPALPSTVPADLRGTVEALLAKDPARRPTASVVADADERPGVGPAYEPQESGPSDETRVLTTPAPRPDMPPRAGLPPRPRRALRSTAAPGRTAGMAQMATRELRQRPVAALAAAGTVALLLIVALIGLPGGSTPTAATPARASGEPPATGAAGPVKVAGVALFHPGGSGDDHPGDVRLAADGNAATVWTTQHYATPTFGNLRPGVGVVFDLGKPVAVGQIRLSLTAPGSSVEIRAGSDRGALLGAPAAASSAAAPAAWQVTPKAGVTGRYWLVWFAKLPSAGQIGIAETAFSG
jgi:serine/threonine-protein kinase